MKLTISDALRAYAKMMNTLDVKHIEPLLAEDFCYSSQWVFEEIKSKQGFIDYISPKLVSIAKSGSLAYAEMCELKEYGGGPCVVIAQGRKDNLIATVKAEVDSGKIKRIDLCQIPPPSAALRTGEYPA